MLRCHFQRKSSSENVILVTGHSAIGFETSAINGQSIAELLATGEIPAIIRPFGLERFTSDERANS
jgi:glycine/D-amino acid oxidase-like deaminating enzyme